MSIEPTPLTPELAAYVVDHVGGRDAVLLDVERQALELGSLARMQTSPDQRWADVARANLDAAGVGDRVEIRIVDPAADDEGARAVAALNDRILADDRVDSVLVGMADGLTLVRRRD